MQINPERVIQSEIRVIIVDSEIWEENSMKKRISAFFVIGILVAFASVCSIGPANISSLKFGTNDKADPARTSFTLGEDIYAVATIANTKQPVKLQTLLTAENVDGMPKGQELLKSTTDVPDARPVKINFLGLIKPGEFKFEATIMDSTGKVLDSKSGIFTINAKEPAATNSKPTTP